MGKRKRVFAAVDVLGLFLHWTNNTMAQNNGVTQCCLCHSIELGVASFSGALIAFVMLGIFGQMKKKSCLTLPWFNDESRVF